MLYRIHAGTTASRVYAWGEVKAIKAYEDMLADYDENEIQVEVYQRKQWHVIKGRQKVGKY